MSKNDKAVAKPEEKSVTEKPVAEKPAGPPASLQDMSRAGKGTTGKVEWIPAGNIVVNPLLKVDKVDDAGKRLGVMTLHLNHRRSLDNIESLAESIRETGLDTPLEVWRVKMEDGRTEDRLNKGHRRMAALKLLYGSAFSQTLIPCEVKHFASTTDALVANLRENVGREEVSSAEIASRLAALVKMGARQKDLATQVALSPESVSNLVTLWNTLHPSIVDLWMSPRVKLTLPYLLRIKKLSHEEQLAKIREDKPELFEEPSEGGEESGEESGEGEGEGERGREEKKPQTKKAIADALESLKAQKADCTDPERLQRIMGAIKAINWVLGGAKKLKV